MSDDDAGELVLPWTRRSFQEASGDVHDDEKKGFAREAKASSGWERGDNVKCGNSHDRSCFFLCYLLRHSPPSPQIGGISLLPASAFVREILP